MKELVAIIKNEPANTDLRKQALDALKAIGSIERDDSNALSFDALDIRVNQRTFKIPINLSAERRNGFAGMRLMVSMDEGKTWKAKAIFAPDAESFTFTADKDGVYWFAFGLEYEGGAQGPVDLKHPVKVRVATDKK